MNISAKKLDKGTGLFIFYEANRIGKKMKLYSYVVKCDTGFAPNPFYRYCTLAACTPNHMGICPQKGDWIIGTGAVAKGNRLIYAMQVSDKMPFDQYYKNPSFERKKPVIESKDYRRRCGDNIYYRDKAGHWQQHPSSFHNTKNQKKQDLKHPYVFIAKRFCYFGCKAKKIPREYNNLIWKRQGVKCFHDPEDIEGFLAWLHGKKTGIHGRPRDCGADWKCSRPRSSGRCQ